MEEFLKSRDLPARGVFWEMGTGKTKLQIDNAAYLFMKGEINGLFVIAPNGVHRNWVMEEIPAHMPESLLGKCRSHWYAGSRHASVSHRREVERLLDHPKSGLATLAMSFDSMMTDHGREVAKKFLTSRRCLYIVDEARRIKDPSAKRTKRILSSAPYAPYRRVLNGTPIANGPFDVYSQIMFLDADFWNRNGIGSFAGFRTMFATFRPIKVGGGRTVNVVDSYRNLELLSSLIDQICTRVTKEDVLDLPPKLFSVRKFDLTPEQDRAYQNLTNDFMSVVDTPEGSGLVSAPLALVRLLRLQQVTCGYLPTDDPDRVMVDIGVSNPRLELLREIVEDIPHKAIIWTRFTRDTDKICEMLGDKAVRYDGSVDDDGRAEAIRKFQKSEEAQFFVANPQAAGEGLTLHAAKTVIYYSHSFNLAERLQSEDRAHRIGQTSPVQYIDLVADGTVDEHIVETLRDKLDIASQITGDRLRDWLR
jgi:SNF2 family DNA or RNA helicase